jgi:Fe-S cluster assembly iron-binding protein IscA
MALKVSGAAVKQVKDLKQAQNLGDDVFLRMGVKGGGCSGMSYALEFDNELGPRTGNSRSMECEWSATRRATST